MRRAAMLVIAMFGVVLMLPAAAHAQNPELAVRPQAGRCNRQFIVVGRGFDPDVDLSIVIVLSGTTSRESFDMTALDPDGSFSVALPRPFVAAGCEKTTEFQVSAVPKGTSGPNDGVIASTMFTVMLLTHRPVIEIQPPFGSCETEFVVVGQGFDPEVRVLLMWHEQGALDSSEFARPQIGADGGLRQPLTPIFSLQEACERSITYVIRAVEFVSGRTVALLASTEFMAGPPGELLVPPPAAGNAGVAQGFGTSIGAASMLALTLLLVAGARRSTAIGVGRRR